MGQPLQLRRSALYSFVREKAVKRVAADTGFSDAALAKTCRRDFVMQAASDMVGVGTAYPDLF